jgi:hypothetical protein
VSKLRRHFGDELVDEIPQGFRRLSEPSKLLEALIVSGNLTHDTNPCMAWCMGNMAQRRERVARDSSGEDRPAEAHRRRRGAHRRAREDDRDARGATVRVSEPRCAAVWLYVGVAGFSPHAADVVAGVVLMAAGSYPYLKRKRKP